MYVSHRRIQMNEKHSKLDSRVPVIGPIFGLMPIIAYGGPTTDPTSSMYKSSNHLFAHPPNKKILEPFASYTKSESERGFGASSPSTLGALHTIVPVSRT